MSSPLRGITPETRRNLIAGIDAGRLAPPFAELMVRRYVSGHACEAVAAELQRLAVLGVTPQILREMLVLIDEGGEIEPVRLVWTGPEDVGAETRDTGVVLRELFGAARRSVLIAGFAVYQGKEVFEVLAARMDAHPELEVRMYLNISRSYGDPSDAKVLLRKFAERFREEEWPGVRRPAVFYDPRALAVHEKGAKQAALHAKCLVVDGEQVFVTSANFTEAAQERNIEVGVLLRNQALARNLEGQFESLVTGGHLRSLPGL